MAQPIWITPAGNLGSIPEEVFFQIPVVATDPDDPFGDTVKYRVIAGSLPAGLQLSDNGLLTGTPTATATIQGVPTNVPNDVTSKFAVRAYTETLVESQLVVDRFADRTFTITVTGQNIPQFVTQTGLIATFDDAGPRSFQLEFVDNDADDVVNANLASGFLPPGMSLTRTGLISGVIPPIAENTTYTFSISITDGKSSNLRTFSINVIATGVIIPYLVNNVPSDLGSYRSDNYFAYQFIAADFTTGLSVISISENKTLVFNINHGYSVDSPIVFTITSNGIVGNVTYYVATTNGDDQLTLKDAFNNEITDLTNGTKLNIPVVRFDFIEYVDTGLEFPPGLQLDLNTGWLYGYIPNLGLTELTYDFAIQVQKAGDPGSLSDPYYFTMKVVGELDTNIVWVTPSDLGSIDVGSVSTLKVEAINFADRTLSYVLSDNSLPPGLRLLTSGEISGRPSFNTFSLDNGTTTFDKEVQSRYVVSETTFDLSFTFTVNAFSSDGLINVFKTFTITLNRVVDEPYENLYIKAMPPEHDRDFIDNLLRDPDIFVPQELYRANDPFFGVSKNVVYFHAFGLTSSTVAEYISSLYLNHYWKNLVLGEIDTARALDENGNVLYEVVYSKVIDNLVNNEGISVSKEVTLPYPFTIEEVINEFFSADTTEVTVDTAEVTADVTPINLSETYTDVYPNSLPNMRDQVIDVIGQISNILPRWMTSKQENGRVLGFTPAWVICYAKPGFGKKIAYEIQQRYRNQLNKIDFEVDRYELDSALSVNWDPTANDGAGGWIIPEIIPNDTYITTDDYDKYLVFPKRTILA